MSKFKGLYLQQGSKKFNLGYVELEIQRTLGNPNWEITIRCEDIWGVYKAWSNNQTFQLSAEWTSKAYGVTVLESISGMVVIMEVNPNKTPSPSSGIPCYTISGVSPNLTVSGIPDNERVKVMFD